MAETNNLTPPPEVLFSPNALEEYRRVLEVTRHQNAWREIRSELPPESKDLFMDLISLRANLHSISLSPANLDLLTWEYSDLRNQLIDKFGFASDDQTIDHHALIDLFLDKKGLLKPAAAPSKIDSTLRKVGRIKSDQSLKGKAKGVGLAALATFTILGGGVVAANIIRDAMTQVDVSKVPEIEVKKAPEFLKPFISEANKKRLERAKYDSEFFHRVDPELNRNRLNIVLHEYGQDFNPSLVAPVKFDSTTILSYNSEANQFDIITFDDIRAPEIEKLHSDKKPEAISINRAYKEGGFDLMRKTIEGATGLIVDGQVNMSDQFIVDFVNDIMNGVAINIPFSVRTSGNYLDGKPRPPYPFEVGPITLQGERALAFIKGQPINEDLKKPEKSRDRRRNLFIEAVINQLSKGFKDTDSKVIAWFFQTNALKGV